MAKKKSAPASPPSPPIDAEAPETDRPSCPRCGGRRALPTGAEREQYYTGVSPAGKPYEKIVRRWLRCEGCGQVRVERTYV